MNQSRIVTLAVVALIGDAAAALAGPCTTQIVEVEQYIERATAAAASPSAPQSVGAQLHHQPTPQAVEGAESKARAAAEVILERARKADAEGDAAACAQALDEVKLLYP